MTSREEVFTAETKEQIAAHAELRKKNINPKRPGKN
jgi:hypothetical protein